MHRFPLSKFFMLVAISLGLAACGGNAPTLNIPVSAANAYLLTTNDKIVGVDLDNMEYARGNPFFLPRAKTSTPEDGLLDLDEVVLDIDYRNSEGALYALTRTGTKGRIIRINPSSGSFIRVSTLVRDGNSTEMSLPTTVGYTIDFDPVEDRLRIIGSNGDNWRADALTGDTLLDTPISGNTITGAAYEDNFSSVGRGTRLFTLDAGTNSGTNSLYLQGNPNPNDGTQNSAKVLLSDSAVMSIDGYDIYPANNFGYAMMTVGGVQSVYRIDPMAPSNAASLFGSPPRLTGGGKYKALTFITSANPTVTALTKTNELVTFRALEPTSVSTPTASGVSGDTIVGIDFRQSDRVLYGLGLSGQVYNLAASTSSTTTGALSSSNNYTLDFDPAAAPNKLRLIDSSGSNDDIDIDTAAKVAKPRITSSTTVTPVVAGLAYTNNFRSSTATQLLAIDRANSTLNLIALTAPTAPATTPLEGSLTTLTTLGITLDRNSPVGFDISGRNNDNQLLMARTATSGNFTLYRVNPAATSNPLTPIGEINSSDTFIDIAIRF